jgi:S1-C subfamily serine protease
MDAAGGLMARARNHGIFVLSSLACAPLLISQQKLPRIAFDVKETVVKIEVHLTSGHDSERVSDQLKRCFEDSDYCVIGTGVRINAAGDVLTAAHVARDANVVTQTLESTGIESEVMVAGAARNAEYVHANAESMGGASRASIKAIDAEHDLAVFEPEAGGQAFTSIDDQSRSGRQGRREAKLDLERPAPGEAIFAFGFPEYSPGLISSTGSITLAVGSTNLVEAKKSGDTALVPIYRAGLEINPGNSGVLLFRSSDGALRGIVSEIAEGREIIATVVPASEIAKVLSKYAIRWDTALAPASSAKTKFGRRRADSH